MEVNELKEFILWCRAQKIKKVLLASGDSFEFSDLAFIEDLTEQPEVKEMDFTNSKDMADTLKPQTKEELEADLFWSSTLR